MALFANYLKINTLGILLYSIYVLRAYVCKQYTEKTPIFGTFQAFCRVLIAKMIIYISTQLDALKTSNLPILKTFNI